MPPLLSPCIRQRDGNPAAVAHSAKSRVSPSNTHSAVIASRTSCGKVATDARDLADGWYARPGVALHVRETVGGKCLSHIRYVGLTPSRDLFGCARYFFVEAKEAPGKVMERSVQVPPSSASRRQTPRTSQSANANTVTIPVNTIANERTHITPC